MDMITIQYILIALISTLIALVIIATAEAGAKRVTEATNKKVQKKMLVVSESAYAKATESRRNEDRFEECLDQKICPACGQSLNQVAIGGENLLEYKYSCVSCDFIHERMES